MGSPWHSGGSRELALNWLRASADGYCEETSEGPSNCERDGKGAWFLPNSTWHDREPWVACAQWCLARCARCARCTHVSLSLKWMECSWFARCNSRSLRHKPNSFRTMALADMAMPLAPPAQGEEDVRIAQRGHSNVATRSEEHDRLDSAPWRLRQRPYKAVELPDPASLARPLLLIGLISGSMERRKLLRCTWGRVLERMGGGIRLRFLAGAAEPDAHRPDVLPVPVAEHVAIARPPWQHVGLVRARNVVGSWTQYVKVVHFLRFAAEQPEPMVAKGDDDVFIQPRMAFATAWLLLQQAEQEGMNQHRRRGQPTDQAAVDPGAHVLAGVYEWYSWKPYTLESSAWDRKRWQASFKAQVDWRDCSPNGGGWRWDGWDFVEQQRRNKSSVPRGPEGGSRRRSQQDCHGPFAFARGPLKFLSAPAVRWLVRSRRFKQGVRRAEQLAGQLTNGSSGGGGSGGGSSRQAPPMRVSEDAQMGFWMSAHPALRVVHFPHFAGWVSEFGGLNNASFPRLLLAHRVPWDQMRWLTEQTERLWAVPPGGPASSGARTLQVRAFCDANEPPCARGVCAHAQGQRACGLEVALPESAASRGMGCMLGDCWATAPSGAITRSGGTKVFRRDSHPQLPSQCWQEPRQR